MKTAMQEFIDNVIPMHIIELDIIKQEIKKALEKEKEQIMNAYSDGARGGANGTKGQHDFGWVSRYTRKKYYNQTYNQKQHIIDIMKADEDDDLYNQIN